jgi:hypothetical protein
MKTCVVCQKAFPDDSPIMGTFGSDANAETRYPLCMTCHDNGEHDKWREKSIKFIRDSGVACVTQGNLADDLKQIQEYQRSSSRIADGVCPNGCALMLGDEHDMECPVCKFQFHHRRL